MSALWQDSLLRGRRSWPQSPLVLAATTHQCRRQNLLWREKTDAVCVNTDPVSEASRTACGEYLEVHQFGAPDRRPIMKVKCVGTESDDRRSAAAQNTTYVTELGVAMCESRFTGPAGEPKHDDKGSSHRHLTENLLKYCMLVPIDVSIVCVSVNCIHWRTREASDCFGCGCTMAALRREVT